MKSSTQEDEIPQVKIEEGRGGEESENEIGDKAIKQEDRRKK